jgi:hypothetical protein
MCCAVLFGYFWSKELVQAVCEGVVTPSVGTLSATGIKSTPRFLVIFRHRQERQAQVLRPTSRLIMKGQPMALYEFHLRRNGYAGHRVY